MHLSASNLGVDPWEPLGIFTDQHSQINLSAVYQKRLPLAPPPEATVGSDGTLGHKVQYFKVLPNCNKILLLPCPGLSPGSPHPPPPPPPPPTAWVMVTEKCILSQLLASPYLSGKSQSVARNFMKLLAATVHNSEFNLPLAQWKLPFYPFLVFLVWQQWYISCHNYKTLTVLKTVMCHIIEFLAACT